MNFDRLYVFVFFAIFSIENAATQNTYSQPSKLVKSVLTQAGSSSVTYNHTDERGLVITTKVKQSIGQNGVVGLSNTSLNGVQQGFLNNTKVFKIDNTDVEFVETIDLSVYPNPFKNVVNIKFSKPSTFPIYIEVFDIRGRLVLDQEFQPSNLVSIATDRLQDASYIIRISSGSQAFLKKLIKGIN